jgi:hypothetical protein
VILIEFMRKFHVKATIIDEVLMKLVQQLFSTATIFQMGLIIRSTK